MRLQPWRTGNNISTFNSDSGNKFQSYLQSKNTNSTSSLYQNNLTRLQGLQAIKRIPTGKRRAWESTRFKRSQIAGSFDKTLLVENRILAESAVDSTAQTGGRGMWVNGAILVALVEESCDLIALLEFNDLGSYFEDFAGTVGSWDDGEVEGEGVCALTMRCELRCSNRVRSILAA